MQKLKASPTVAGQDTYTQPFHEALTSSQHRLTSWLHRAIEANALR